ncbi:MAG: hypothetical protein U0W24_08905 [Bacteroidales bacterium]
MKKIAIAVGILALIILLVISAKPGKNIATAENSKHYKQNSIIEKPKKNIKVNGKIVFQDSLLTVIKVWGTHYDRGLAYGYLLGERIKIVYEGYIGKAMKENLAKAKKAVASNKYLTIDEKYIEECKAIVAGMDSAGVDLSGFSYEDLIVANSFLDLQSIIKGYNLSNGCSSLMAWGKVTAGSELKGKSMVTRNLDWTAASKLLRNNLIVIHIPAEKDEQPWLSVGYVGHVGALSGTNKSGLSVFQHVMYDDIKVKDFLTYEPVWFSMRKALEQNDFDKSGQNDVNDLKSVLIQNKNGYAAGYILSALAPSTAGADSLIAMVAELAPDKPLFTFRNSSFDDKFNQNMLYAANYPISRNNEKRYCKRYDGTINAVNKIQNLDPETAWQIMAKNSCLPDVNLQMIQVIPEMSVLKISLWKSNKGAFNYAPQLFNLKDLFAPEKIKK